MTDHLDISRLEDEPEDLSEAPSLDSLRALASSRPPPPISDDPVRLDLTHAAEDLAALAEEPLPIPLVEHALPLSAYPSKRGHAGLRSRWTKRAVICACALGVGAVVAALAPGRGPDATPAAAVAAAPTRVTPVAASPRLAHGSAAQAAPAAIAPADPARVERRGTASVDRPDTVEPAQSATDVVTPTPVAEPTARPRRAEARPTTHASQRMDAARSVAPAAAADGRHGDDDATPSAQATSGDEAAQVANDDAQADRAAAPADATPASDTPATAAAPATAAPAAHATAAASTGPRNLDALIAAALPSASPAQPVARTPAPAAVPARPSRDQVMHALEAGLPALQQCAANRHGLLRASITFKSSGHVERAVVTGTFAGTTEGSCIARKLRGLEVHPFTEDSFVVEWPTRL